jgi:hypothetical protein
MADGWDAVSIAVVVGLFGFHIVQQRCSAPASETVEGEREGMEGGKMQDAGQRRLGPQREDMRREDQAVGVSQARHLQQQPLDDGGLPLVGRGDVPEL